MRASNDVETGITIAPHVVVHRAPPDLLSQRNVEDVIGVSRSIYLRELVGAFRAAGGDVAERGKLRLVRREAFIAWLMASRSLRTSTTAPVSNEEHSIEEELGLAEVVPLRGRGPR